MQRKVNLVGRNTLTVSLPTDWCRSRGVRKGDEIELSEVADGLLIETKHNENHPLEGSIHFSRQGRRFVRSQIARLYRHGYDKIHFSIQDKSLLVEVKTGVDLCLGSEITELNGKKGTITFFIKKEPIDIHKHLIKFMLSLQEVLNQLREDCENNQTSPEQMVKLRLIVWRLRDFILRQANLSHLPQDAHIALSNFLTHIERIAPDMVRYYREGIRAKQPVQDVQKTIGVLQQQLRYITKIIMTHQEISPAMEAKIRNRLDDHSNYIYKQKPTSFTFLAHALTLHIYCSISHLALFLQFYKK